MTGTALKLYEIAEALQPLLEIIEQSFYIDDETGEVIAIEPDPAMVEETVGLVGLGNAKVANIGFIIRNLEAARDAHKLEADRHRKAARIADNKIKWLKAYALDFLKASRQKSIESEDGLIKLSARKGVLKATGPGGCDLAEWGKAHMVELSEWPDEFRKITVEPRKKPLTDAFKTGREDIPGSVEFYEGDQWGTLTVK